MRPIRILGLLFIIGIVILLGFAYAEYSRWTSEPLPIDSSVIITVTPGTPVQALAGSLAQQQILPHARDLAWQARLFGKADQIKAGEYRLQAGITAEGLLDMLVEGDVMMHSITVIEGSTFADLLRQVQNHPAIKHTLEKSVSGDEVMAAIGHTGQHPEGRFMPETYFYPRGTTDVEFLRRAYGAMETFLRKAWEQRPEDLYLDSPYEVLILASIVERETGLAEERARIAGVFTRRLKKGMRLQTDPTVIYGVIHSKDMTYDGDITFKHLNTDTPYNTYMNAGLPPTPISLPGKAAIRAALHPAEGDALYFVATDDGGHVFSATLEEHNAAVRKYQLERNQ